MALTPRSQDFSAWYNELVQQADLAQNSDVRGCMVIKPYGYAIWEHMQQTLDTMFKATGHQNAYFPLFIPKSYLSKEASHVEWFAKECAVVTHYRLKNDPDGTWVIVDPDAKLEEELIVRPTSETIIWSTYKDWINSYRDLPLLINQWANVVRREMRTRLFLRTAEFLRQEGHTAHASKEEAVSEAEQMLHVYDDFLQNIAAISPVLGRKTANERFAGAEDTYCLEAYMQDGKALQAGTSHFLGQNFAKAFDVQFTNKDNKLEYVWATSWGVSTRLMGALVMSHSDDKGLVLPPALAPVHIVIVPICKKEGELEELMKHIDPLLSSLKGKTFTIHSKILGDIQIPIKIKVDDDLNKWIGRKYTQHELQWIPLIIAFGKKDIEKKSLERLHRDIQKWLNLEWLEYIPGFKNTVTYDGTENFWKSLAQMAIEKLEQIQSTLLTYNKKMREENTVSVDKYNDFKKALDDNKFVMAHWDGTTETELKIKEETKATIRCIPLDSIREDWTCILTGKPSEQRVLFARAY
jgi:prolyl-tRNA synthetase